MVDRAPDAARYRAFLSYSHKDAAAAGRLHRRLETYRLPKRLVGTETARGTVPERLAPIFRDRDELPAATDLSEQVRVALAESGALIILCSPAAASSFWVAEEIRTFRAMHPDRPILAAIVDGEPSECFPESLRTSGPGGARVEPLATDLRPQHDGKHLGLLKLVAGITGVPLDALVQRDAARRVRRVMAVTAVAVVAMLIMAALTLFALDARREAEGQRAEAEHQRAEAEGLIEYMLTDLRQKLKGVANLEVMTGVNQRALLYYGGQKELGNLSGESLERRARVLHALGEDDKSRGNLKGALAAFREAHRITAEQLARAPDDPDRIFAHSQSEYWLGSVDEMLGNYPAALTAYRRYRTEARRMNQLRAGNPKFLGELAYSESNLGSVNLTGLKRPQLARQHFQASLRWFHRALELQPANPEWRVQIADAHSYIADTWLAERRYREARAERLEERRIKLELLRKDPNNQAYFFAALLPDRALARIAQEQGQYGLALTLLEAMRPKLAALLKSDPANLAWCDVATRVEADLAHLSILRGDAARASKAIAEAVRLMAIGDRLSSGRSALREPLRDRIGMAQRDLVRLKKEKDDVHR